MVNDMISKMMKEKKHKKEFADRLTNSTEYMDWLRKFTEKRGSFSTDSFLYDQEDLTEDDLVNVQDVQLLFEEILDYSDENYIDPVKIDYGAYYSIKDGDVGYYIGYNAGQGTSFYCLRLDEPEEDALDIKHVRSGVKLPKTAYDEYLLEELEDIMEKLYDDGVSLNAIKTVTNSTLDRLKAKSDQSIRNKAK